MTTPQPEPLNLTAEEALAGGHSWQCDYVRTPGDRDNECYCPTPEERAEQRRYEAALADGEPPEPYWTTPRSGE